MSTIIEILTAAALILSIIIPGGAFLLGERNKKRYKKSLAVNCFFFFVPASHGGPTARGRGLGAGGGALGRAGRLHDDRARCRPTPSR